MNTTALKYIAGIIVVLAIIGAYVYPKSTTTTVVRGVSGTAVTNSSARIATITMAPLLDAGTSTTILNTDGTDRAITSSVAYCTSVGTSRTYLTGATGLSNLIVNMSTSSSASGNAGSNTNYASSLTIATTSVTAYTASSTEGATIYGRIWPTGTYLALTFNATNTAACTVGVYYLSL